MEKKVERRKGRNNKPTSYNEDMSAARHLSILLFFIPDIPELVDKITWKSKKTKKSW